jgi:hypothetical protein
MSELVSQILLSKQEECYCSHAHFLVTVTAPTANLI